MISEVVSVPAARVTLGGELTVPEAARAVVLLPHGVDASRHDAPSRSIAARWHTAGFATLSVDLLSELEERRDTRVGEQRFDVGLLARRLAAAVDWVGAQPGTRALPVVLCTGGTQADTVLEAAAELPDRVLTVVLWGGRPDPEAETIRRVRVPVLFIVGGQDPGQLRLTEEGARRLTAPHTVRLVPEATHLFEEPGALDQVVVMATEWCDEQLRSSRAAPR
ncbi:dienelactone hydrolase family protein [Streptomyces sp. GESEQ-4]|uniref:dienelactone hydrolase family protein n=1 Tax=Streptomyces sp. GESEQ-4 TaxID=2812655 RepID=UPI001B32590F|nr:dienelactone hydrolase family protein [Streptomyces sp. GESEQ-4]